jgi:hypothetical protein
MGQNGEKGFLGSRGCDPIGGSSAQAFNFQGTKSPCALNGVGPVGCLGDGPEWTDFNLEAVLVRDAKP